MCLDDREVVGVLVEGAEVLLETDHLWSHFLRRVLGVMLRHRRVASLLCETSVLLKIRIEKTYLVRS